MKSAEKDNDGLSPALENDFHGYTMDELRYQRALLLIKREFVREKAMKEMAKLKDRIPGVGNNSAFGKISTRGVIGKLVRGLDLADYLMLGFQTVRIGKKVGNLFKRK